MQEIELDEEDVETILRLLEKNQNAVEKGEALRWTPKAASKFSAVRARIAAQTDLN